MRSLRPARLATRWSAKYPRELLVYGSYVRGELHVSDVDIAVDLAAKSDSTNKREWRNERLQVARADGSTFANFTDVLFWPEHEIMLHLKARTRGLSLHRLDDFIGMEKDKDFTYRVLVSDAARVAEQITRGRSGLTDLSTVNKRSEEEVGCFQEIEKAAPLRAIVLRRTTVALPAEDAPPMIFGWGRSPASRKGAI